MANVTVGHLICPIMGDRAEVRRDKRRKLYYVGLAGKITPNLVDGQNWLQKITEFIGDNGTPLTAIEKPVIPINEKTEPEIKPVISVNEKTPVNASKSLMNFLFKADE